MNLITGRSKNFHDDEDAQIEDDEEEEEEDDDEEEDEEEEPDFMDENTGKFWEFASKIRGEKHLKEWCQNKMGGMNVGKEEKLTRQFHCPIKECQFKAIFLKSCSIVYTRNKHSTHLLESARNIRQKEEEKTKTPSQSTTERDYVDRNGKLWPFHAYVGKNISHDKLLNKFGFTGIHKNNKSLNLYCAKRNPDGGYCPFSGIYLISNGCLYTRGEHEHSKRGKIPENIGDDFMDHFDKIWKFNKEIGKNIQPQLFKAKFGFHGIKKNESGLYLQCRKKNPGDEICKFVGIYLKSNGCLYTREKHNHEHIEKEYKPNVGDTDDYVDHFGKIWPFRAKIDKDLIPNEIIRNKFGFTKIFPKQHTLNLYCQKEGIDGGKCPISGIYVKENGCLYIRGKHEHKYDG